MGDVFFGQVSAALECRDSFCRRVIGFGQATTGVERFGAIVTVNGVVDDAVEWLRGCACLRPATEAERSASDFLNVVQIERGIRSRSITPGRLAEVGDRLDLGTGRIGAEDTGVDGLANRVDHFRLGVTAASKQQVAV